MKRRILNAIIGVTMVLTMVACGSEKKPPVTDATVEQKEQTDAETETKQIESEKLKIGVTVQDLTNPYFIAVTNGMKDYCEEKGYELVIHDGKADVMNQVDAIENFVSQGVSAIIICPVEEVAPEAAVKSANDAGIPVVSLAQFVKGSNGFIRLNEKQYGEEGGIIAGQWIKKTLVKEEDAKVLILGNPELQALIERSNGLKEGILKEAPNATIVAEQAANTTELAMSITENTLLKNPDINVVVATNDASALGAYEALMAAGKKPGEACVVGLDATPEAISKIKEGGIFVGTVDVGSYQQGALCIETVERVIKEGKQEDTYVSFIKVTAENASAY